MLPLRYLDFDCKNQNYSVQLSKWFIQLVKHDFDSFTYLSALHILTMNMIVHAFIDMDSLIVRALATAIIGQYILKPSEP